MRFTTTDNREVTWFDGVIAGDIDLVFAVQSAVIHDVPCAFNYWGAQGADISSEFRAYLTIGSVLTDVTGETPSVDLIPDNPDGYEEEGPIDVIEVSPLVAAALRHMT